MTSANGDLVTVIDEFLSPADCARLLAQAEAGVWVKSAVAMAGGMPEAVGTGRRSDTLWLPAFGRWAAAKLRRIEVELSARLGIEPAHLEPWQMTRYRRGDAFDYHLDCGAWAEHPSGERKRTILIIIEPPLRGGATHFRALSQTIRPRLGRLIVWRNLLPTGGCNHAMIHSGRAVWRGQKTILTTWERERPFISGGQ